MAGTVAHKTGRKRMQEAGEIHVGKMLQHCIMHVFWNAASTDEMQEPLNKEVNVIRKRRCQKKLL